MDKLPITPTFIDDSSSDENIDKLLSVLAANNIPTQELLGVFVYNARHEADRHSAESGYADPEDEDTDMFSSPISIDPYDQQRLSELSLVTTLAVSINRIHDRPIPILTSLGTYVMRHAVLTSPLANMDYLPRLVPDSLYEKLS